MKKNNPWDEINSSNKKINFNAINADVETLLDFYWAKDYSGSLLFIVHTNLDIATNGKLPILNGLKLSVGDLEEKKQLVLRLQDNINSDLFYILCKDLISVTKNIKDESISIQRILKRLIQWQYFLKNNSKQIDKKQLKGLIGELYLLKQLLSYDFKVDEVLSFWKAPWGSVHDFELLNTTLEVKTKTSVNTISISSYEQMLTELDDLYLFVVTLNESTKNSVDSFNIYDLIYDIKEKINTDNVDACERLDNLLFAYGFIELPEYQELYFSIKSYETYFVTDSFPKISSKPEAIENLTYRINLENCKEYLITNLIDKIKDNYE